MNKLLALCWRNPRLIFVQALSFVGPICEPFRLRAPGFQFVGRPGSGKTTAGIIAGANWGGDPDSSLGFGSSWNGTPNGLEEFGPAHHQTFMFLDETGMLPTDNKGCPISFSEAVMRLSQGQGKKRQTELQRALWSSTLLSTSNASVYSMLEPAHQMNYEAYVDRLVDIPVATGRESIFENLHGFENEHQFGMHLFNIATSNYGQTSRKFIRRLGSELANGRGKLTEFVKSCVDHYQRRAANISSPKRNVLRVGGHFGTVYAAGCLAIRYGIFPFGEAEVLDAILAVTAIMSPSLIGYTPDGQTGDCSAYSGANE